MRYHRFAVLTIFFICGFIFANYAARLPDVEMQYQLTHSLLGRVLLCGSIGALSAMPFAGWLTVRFGSRQITAWAAVFFSIMVCTIPLLPNIWALAGAFVVMGFANGALDIAMNSQAVAVERMYERPLMSSFHAAFSVGTLVGALGASIFTKMGTTLVQHFSIIGCITFLLAVWAGRNLVKDDLKSTEKTTTKFQLPTRALAGLGLITFCCMLGEGAMADWTTIYMHKNLGFDTGTAPLGYAAVTAAMTLGRLFGDGIVQRLGNQKVLIASSILALSGLILALATHNIALVISGFFIVGLGIAVIVPITYNIGGNSKEFPAGVGLAMITTIGYAGFVIGPPTIGFLADVFSLQAALGIVAMLFFVMLLLSLRVKTP
jgi:MFS family permease